MLIRSFPAVLASELAVAGGFRKQGDLSAQTTTHDHAAVRSDGIIFYVARENRGPALRLARIGIHGVEATLVVLVLPFHAAQFHREKDVAIVGRPGELFFERLVVRELA